MSDDFHSFIEAVVQRCPVKKVFLEISQNSQENTCASLFFNKVAVRRLNWKVGTDGSYYNW